MPSDRYPYHIVNKPYDFVLVNVEGAFRPTRMLGTIIDLTTRVGMTSSYSLIWDFRNTEKITMDRDAVQSLGWKINCQKVHGLHQAMVVHNGKTVSQVQAIIRCTSVSMRENTRFFMTLGHAVDWLGTFIAPAGWVAA